MRRKVKRVLLINGIATININGDVKSSIDMGTMIVKQTNLKMYYDDHGVWVSYTGHKGEPLEQLIPRNVISNILFDPAEKWEDEPKKAAK